MGVLQVTVSLHQTDDDGLLLAHWDITSKVTLGRLAGTEPKEIYKPFIDFPDPFLSQIHAQIWLRPDGEQVWFIEDLGSTNGTRVNTRLIRDLCRLNHGDVITVGRTNLIFVMHEMEPA